MVSPVFTAKEIATDDAYTRDEYDRRPTPSPLAIPIFRKSYGPDVVDAEGTVPAAAARGLLVGGALQTYFKENKTPIEEIMRMNNCRTGLRAQPIQGVRARSLEGILFTAPYLHNGSVSTIVDLLKPAKDRAQSFYLGCRKYDVVKMGFDCKRSDVGAFYFDVRLRGNSNLGHEYGTELGDLQKKDLVEYLKTLEQPRAPERNAECG
ncbi:MAG: hypothetical protein EOP06_12780 [Proteobacteria bacterium]|nr:MAG: hypothetical protein EOP06_12780 [Pseudomonadota bacterium]